MQSEFNAEAQRSEHAKDKDVKRTTVRGIGVIPLTIIPLTFQPFLFLRLCSAIIQNRSFSRRFYRGLRGSRGYKKGNPRHPRYPRLIPLLVAALPRCAFALTTFLLLLTSGPLRAEIVSSNTNLTAREEQIIAAAKSAPEPRFNGASIIGVHPRTPLLYSLAVSGQRPLQFS